MAEKKELTKQHKVYYNGSIPIRHCAKTIAFTLNGKIYIPCRKCKKWIEYDPGKIK